MTTLPEPDDVDASAPPPKTKRSRGRPRASAGSGEDGGIGRETLIDAAVEMLRTRPPIAITPVSVARDTGVHPSLIRYYFRNRPSLLVAVVERLTERFAAEVEAAPPKGANAEARLCARIGRLIDLNAAYPFFHQLFVSEIAASDDPDAHSMITRFTQRGIGAYGTILRGGLADGSFRGMDPGLLYVAVIGMAEFFVAARRQLEIAQGTPIDEAELRSVYKAFVCDLVLNGVRSR